MAQAEKVIIDIIANDKATSILENVRGKLIEINNLASKYGQMVSSVNQNVSNAQSKINENINPNNSSSSSKQGSSNTDNVTNTKLEDFNQPNAKPKTEPIRTQTKLEAHNQPEVTPKVNTREVQARLDGFKPTLKPQVDGKSIDNAILKTNNFGQTISQASTNGAKSINTLTESTNNASNSADKLGSSTKNAMRVGTSAFHEMNNLMVTVGGQFTNLSSQIAGIFGAMGLSGMVEKMWKGASERQTNMLYLMHQRGVEQANQYYNEIMDIVTQLPGDDTFLTNILNMSAAMDKNIKLDNLKELGSAITDYYIASTMKGELPFETQKDMRKYMTTGDTRPLRNSLLASEIDLLKNKNSILERGKALQEALDKTGFTGMSQYESATNALEELKGHFQKAFADIGGLVIAVTQPVMKFYNALDTLFGSRISQAIILVATAFVGFFGAIGVGMVIIPTLIRNFEILGMGLRMLTWITESNVVAQGGLNTILTMLIGKENALAIAKDGNVVAGIREIGVTYSNIIAKRLDIEVTEGQTIGLMALSRATLVRIKEKIMSIAITIKNIAMGIMERDVELAKIIIEYESLGVAIASKDLEEAKNIVLGNSIRLKILSRVETIKSTISTIGNTIAIIPNVFAKWRKNEASLADTFAEELNTIATSENTNATLINALSKLRGIINTIELIASVIFLSFVQSRQTEVTFREALSHNLNTVSKMEETFATYGLATATAILDALMSPLTLTILAIVGAILLLVTVIEKVGEAFGWWSDFGSMISAIGDGINRLWNAFVGSDVIQGIIQYFTDFVSVLQYVWDSVSNLFGAIFGWNDDNTGTFDIVQSIINVFGTLGEIIKWVWNLMDDWSNSPLGIITWLNPLGILIFHLDEIGSLFEDIGDAINRFTQTTEFNELMEAFGEVWNEIQEPFQEIWSLINEIIGLFGELFGSDPVGQGTEERINFLVEILRGVAVIIRVVVIPAIRGIALAIRIVLTPLRVVLTVIRAIVGAIPWATGVVDIFGVAWQVLTAPITLVQKILQGIGDVVNMVSNAIKNSIIGKLLGWDKDNKDESGKSQVEGSRKSLYGQMKNKVNSSDMDFVTKNKVLGELDKQNLTASNVNNVRNLGRTYNNHNNQRQVVINQNFSEGSMPIDARNMTKKEAKKMFVGAFGYNRAVGRKGILR